MDSQNPNNFGHVPGAPLLIIDDACRLVEGFPRLHTSPPQPPHPRLAQCVTEQGFKDWGPGWVPQVGQRRSSPIAMLMATAHDPCLVHAARSKPVEIEVLNRSPYWSGRWRFRPNAIALAIVCNPCMVQCGAEQAC